ncbi:hypothetical protein OTU49_010156 [Cherax quadricarinatus]|uniref:Lipase n=2 Tax=Cherax quadricarinatus TaxID=27406 RepID=A0AAW0YBE2_CHEQU|nr:gastric triacylglycerol lipase-like isoform X2 [Cherax quadricarinatus]
MNFQLWLLLVLTSIYSGWCVRIQSENYNPDIDLDVPGLINKYGYPVEIHTVTTDDGFILTLHRIPHGRVGTRSENEIQTREPVLMQHGLLASSCSWILASPEKAPAYIMADAGYDVWLGNARGNRYSRAHTRLSPDEEKFWDFSWDEMASLDIPAVIDYILLTTKHQQLYYIGHSMGTTIFFACMATQTKYQSKVKAMFALAPVANVSYIKSPIKYLAPFASVIEKLMELLGEYEFLPHNDNFTKWKEYVCTTYNFEELMCRNAIFFLTGFDAPQFNLTWLPVILSHNPAGTSVRTVAHYAQQYNDGKFEHYDFGKEENMRRYHQTTPPLYYPTRIKVPVVLMSGKNDFLADPKDVSNLAAHLPNLIINYIVPLQDFNHIDFVWGVDAAQYVYRVILKYMKFF